MAFSVVIVQVDMKPGESVEDFMYRYNVAMAAAVRTLIAEALPETAGMDDKRLVQFINQYSGPRPRTHRGEDLLAGFMAIQEQLAAMG